MYERIESLVTDDLYRERERKIERGKERASLAFTIEYRI